MPPLRREVRPPLSLDRGLRRPQELLFLLHLRRLGIRPAGLERGGGGVVRGSTGTGP